MPSQQRIETLTPRQREILELVAQGLTNDDIGGALAISPGTVRVHLSAILAALEVGNRTEAARVYHASVAEPARVAAVLERPAIAVLPLRALDDDARARTIAAAISDDLAGLFARACWFPVIAQASSAGARALGATSQAMAQALGARFLVDGTLRMGQGGWRVTVEVVDGQGGHCLWTERFDFAQSELFEVQDTVCATIVATAYPVMMTRVQMGLRQAPRPQDLEAWELAHRAMELAARRDHAAATQAREHFALAVRREPTLVLAHYGMGLGAYDDVLNQWGPDELARERLLAAATRCIELAPHAGEGYFLQARYFQTRGDHARAVPALEAAIAHNPSFAQAHALLAQTLQITGRSEEAMLRMKQALRLGPRAFVAGLALLHFMRGELALALDAAEHAVSINPRYTFARVMAATSAHFLGEVARAGEHVQRLRQDYPAFVPARLLRVFGPEVDVVRRISVGLEALGVSE